MLDGPSRSDAHALYFQEDALSAATWESPFGHNDTHAEDRLSLQRPRPAPLRLPGRQDRLPARAHACRLDGRRARLRELDSLLWRFDDLAFLPHVGAASPLAAETPIRLSSRLEELEGDVLLLLDDQLPPEWQERLERFNRIIDVVSTKPDELQASRSRYRAYKAAGVDLAAYDRRS